MNVFQLFTGSFHSAAAYRHMRAKANFGMGYALFVVALMTLFVMLYYSLPIYNTAFMAQGDQPPLFDQLARQVADQAPVMTLKGDTLATKTPDATIITINGHYGQEHFKVPFITVDTTGTTDTDNATTPILVTAKELLVRSKDTWKPQPLSDFTKNGPGIILINHAVADELAERAIAYAHSHFFQYFILIWLFFIICLFVVSFFLLLVLGLIGLLISSFIKSPLSFGAAVGLASLSFTPVALLDAVLLTVFGYAAHAITLLFAGSVTLYAAIKCSEPQPIKPLTV